MKQELQDKLYAKYPQLFAQKDDSPQKTLMCWGITCMDGWYHIIDTTCYMIQSKISYQIDLIARYEKYIEEELCSQKINPDIEKIEVFKSIINKAKKDIIEPVQFVQIKEKFGTLRIYTDYYNEKINSYIEFAEALSERTCEICGAPGKINKNGWLKVRCNKHKEQ